VRELADPIRVCLRGAGAFTQVTLSAVNRRGWSVRVQVQCSRMAGLDAGRPGVILVMEELAATTP
jgi:hypothetical protein